MTVIGNATDISQLALRDRDLLLKALHDVLLAEYQPWRAKQEEEFQKAMRDYESQPYTEYMKNHGMYDSVQAEIARMESNHRMIVAKSWSWKQDAWEWWARETMGVSRLSLSTRSATLRHIHHNYFTSFVEQTGFQ